MSDLLRGNFTPERKVEAQDVKPDERAEFRKRALENIAGSMVFVEDKLLYWDIMDNE